MLFRSTLDLNDPDNLLCACCLIPGCIKITLTITGCEGHDEEPFAERLLYRNGGDPPCVTAGGYCWQDDDNFVRLECGGAFDPETGAALLQLTNLGGECYPTAAVVVTSWCPAFIATATQEAYLTDCAYCANAPGDPYYLTATLEPCDGGAFDAGFDDGFG